MIVAGQVLLFGLGVIMFAGRSISSNNRNREQENDAAADDLAENIITQIIKARIRNTRKRLILERQREERTVSGRIE